MFDMIISEEIQYTGEKNFLIILALAFSMRRGVYCYITPPFFWPWFVCFVLERKGLNNNSISNKGINKY